MIYPALLRRHPIISDQISRPALGVVLRELEQVLQHGVVGQIAEFGCYIGTTSLFMRRVLDETSQSKTRLFYAYDSFAGLPEKTSADSSASGLNFRQGELSTSKKQFLQSFQKANLEPPLTIKNWFQDLTAHQLPDTLAYAFLDSDFYESMLASLVLVWPRLSSGGVITIDDYQRDALPGVTAAVGMYFKTTPIRLRYEHNIAIIKKP